MQKNSKRNVLLQWLTCFLMAFLKKTSKIFLFIIILFPFANSLYAETKLSLKQAIDLGQKHSYLIKQSQNRLSGAEFRSKSAKSHRYPTLSLNAMSFYTDAVANIPLPIADQALEMGSNDNYQFDLKLSIPLFTGGKISDQIKISESVVEAESHTLQANKLTNAYNTRRAYLTYMLMQTVSKSTIISLDRTKVIQKDVRNFHSHGLADSLDVLEAELANQEVLDMLQKQEAAQENARHSLINQIGLPFNEEITITESINIPIKATFEEILGESLIHRSEIMALDQNIDAANNLISLKKSEYFPEIAAYTGYSYGMPNKEYVEPEWNDNIIIGASFNWTFNFGNQVKNNINSAIAQMKVAQFAKERLNESLQLQKKIALTNLSQAFENIDISNKKYNIASEKYRLAEEKQKQGGLSINRLLEMETELTAAEQIYKASIIYFYISKNEYLYVIGSEKIYGGL